MFIAHGEKVRQHAKWVLIAILIVIIPSFVLLFTKTNAGPRGRHGALPTFRGKPIDPAEFEAAKRDVRDQFVISQGRRLPASAQYDDAVTQEAVLRLIMLRKAQQLGLRVSEEQLLGALRQMPAFQAEDGQFNFDRYRRYLIELQANGITEIRFQDLMRDQMLIGQLQNYISDAAKVTPQEVELQFLPLYEKHLVETVSFDVATAKEKPTVTDEDAAASYAKNKDRFKKAAQVKVRFARFSFDAARKTVQITDAEVQAHYNQNLFLYVSTDTNSNKIVTNSLDNVKAQIRDDLALPAAKRKAHDAAEQFSIQIAPAPNSPARVEFAKLAAQAGATVGETDLFTAADGPKGLETGRNFVQAAFALAINPNPPYSDSVLGEDGYYVMEYLESKPERIPELAEVKSAVVEQIQKERIYEATTAAGRQALDSLRKLMADGKSFAEAAAALKLKPQSQAPFSVMGAELEIPGASQVAQTVLGLKPGAVSEFIQTANGGLFYHLKERQPADRAEFEKDKPRYERQLLARQRQALFEGWLGAVMQQEQVSFNRPPPAFPPQDGPSTAEP